MEEKSSFLGNEMEETKLPLSDGDGEKGAMRKRILVLVLLLLCVGALIVLVVLRSGTPIVDFWSIAGSFDPVETEIAAIEKIENVGGVRLDGKGDLVLYEKIGEDENKTTFVVSLSQKKVIGEFWDAETEKNTVTLHAASADHVWYSVKTERGAEDAFTYDLTLFDESGAAFAQKKDMSAAVFSGLKLSTVIDLVRFEKEVFRIGDNGRAKSAFTLSRFAELPAFKTKVGGYYYVLPEGQDGVCYIYNDEAVLTAAYQPPADAKDAKSFILADGTLLAQYVTFEGVNATDYTYAHNGERYKLHHVLVSARNGARTYLKAVDFYIEGILSDNETLHSLGLNTSIDNFASGYLIEDALLDEGEHSHKAVLLSNRGKITSVIGDIIPAMYGGGILGVAKNRWVAVNLAEESFLLNEWGMVIGRFPSLTSETVVAEKLFLHEEKIYDWNLELLYDMEENGILDYELVGTSVLMRKTDGAILLYDGEKQEVITLSTKEEQKQIRVLESTLILLEETSDGVVHQKIYNESNALLLDLAADSLQTYLHTLDGKRTVEILATQGEEVSLYLAATKD